MKSMFYKGENISPWGLIFSLLNRKIRKINYADFQNLSQEEKDGGTLWCVVNAPDIDVLRYYPVGCYFETTDTTFDPNTEWGGTWVLETEGLVHISSGTNYTVSANAQDGGEKVHKLTTAELPSHNHTLQMTRNGQYFNAVWYAGYGAGTARGGINYNETSAGAVPYISKTGSDTAHNNMQPYKIVNRWHRTA